VDAATLKVLNEVRADEDSHLTWVGEALKELEKKEGAEKVAATLSRYRTLEAEAFAEIQEDEQQALQEMAEEKEA
jgi:hypothetical protein